MPLDKYKNALISPDSISTVDITEDYIVFGESPTINRLLKLKINNKCPFDDFIGTGSKKVTNKDEIIEELNAYLILLIEGKTIAPNKLRPIGSNEFEIRIKRTRVYLFFVHPNNRIIVLGHYNKSDNDQQKYIDKFRDLKEKYLKQNEQL